jgi:hypothetical protein
MRIGILFCTVFCLLQLSAQGQVDEKGLPLLVEGVIRKVHQVPVMQIKDPLAVYEDSLIYYADSLGLGKDDEAKLAAAQYMIKLMKPVLNARSSFSYPFTRLRERMNIIEDKSRRFRIYNWDYMRDGGTARYYAVIQFASGKYYPLVDISDQVHRQQEDTVLANRQWFGASYYNLIEQASDKGPIYFLLGYNQSAATSRRKVLDCMTIIGDSAVKFGAPVFENSVQRGKLVNRFVLEYNPLSVVGFNWDLEKRMIVFDHLESNIGDLKKKYTYIPDGTYDGLEWNGKQWRMVNNVVRFIERGDGQAPNSNSNPALKKVLVPQDATNK